MSLGILAAVNQNGLLDYLSVTLAILFYSMPSFVMGFLLILFFAVWLPDHGLDLGFRVSGWNRPLDWVLPTIALGAAPLASLARYTRSSMIDVIRSDYVRTARAKGLSERGVILRHVLNVPGMGQFFVTSMQTQDQTMILAVTLLYGVFLASMNLLVDLAYGVIDPRIRY
jgi:ABC-type dipeptide/oligopeptide/nickel transport system permease component